MFGGNESRECAVNEHHFRELKHTWHVVVGYVEHLLILIIIGLFDKGHSNQLIVPLLGHSPGVVLHLFIQQGRGNVVTHTVNYDFTYIILLNGNSGTNTHITTKLATIQSMNEIITRLHEKHMQVTCPLSAHFL